MNRNNNNNRNAGATPRPSPVLLPQTTYAQTPRQGQRQDQRQQQPSSTTAPTEPPGPESSPPQLIQQDGTFLASPGHGTGEYGRHIYSHTQSVTTNPRGTQNANLMLRFKSSAPTLLSPLLHNYIDHRTREIKDEHSDVEFVCNNGKLVQGHRIVFALFSKFFVTIFKDQADVPKTTVILDSVDSEHMEIVKKFAYRQDENLYIHGKIDLKAVCHLLNSFLLEPELFCLNGISVSPTYWPKREVPVPEPEPVAPEPPVPKSTQTPNIPASTIGSVSEFEATHPPASARTRRNPNPEEAALYRTFLTAQADRSRNRYRTRGQVPVSNANLTLNTSLPPELTPRNRRTSTPGMDDPKVVQWLAQQCSPAPICKVCTELDIVVDEDVEDLDWHVQRHKGLGFFKCVKCPNRYTDSNQLKNHEETTKCQPSSPSPAKLINLGNGRRAQGTGDPGSSRSPSRRRKTPAGAAGASGNNTSGRRRNRTGADGAHGYIYICSNPNCGNRSDNHAVAVHHGKNCPGKSNTLPPELSFEKYPHGLWGEYECPISNCPKRFLTLDGFIRHNTRSHPELANLYTYSRRDKNLCCKVCSSIFTKPIDFWDHFEKNADGQIHRCPNNDLSHGHVNRSNLNMNQSLPLNYSVCEISGNGLRVSFRANHAGPSTVTVAGTCGATGAGASPKKSPGTGTGIPITCPLCKTSQEDVVTHINKAHRGRNIQISYLERGSGANTRRDPENVHCNKCLQDLPISTLVEHLPECISRNLPKVPLGYSRVDRMEFQCFLQDPDLLIRELSCGGCQTHYGKYKESKACLEKKHKILRCSLCFNSYTVASEYKDHIESCHRNAHDRTITCPICQDGIGNYSAACLHVYMKHWIPILRDVIPENEWTQSMCRSGRRGGGGGTGGGTSNQNHGHGQGTSGGGRGGGQRGRGQSGRGRGGNQSNHR